MSIENSEKNFDVVFIPSSSTSPMETQTILQPEGKALQAMTQFCNKHFSKTQLSATQKMNFTSKLSKENKSAQVSALNHLAQITTTDVIKLQPNISETKFIGVNMYVDDKGVAKNLPLNQRAMAIAHAAGVPQNIHGDVFIAKQFDDEEGFNRLNFTEKDLDSSQTWFQTARKINSKRKSQVNKSPFTDKVNTLTNFKAKLLEVVKEKGNSFVSSGKIDKAIAEYKKAHDVLDRNQENFDFNTLDKESRLIAGSIFSNVALCYSKLNKHVEARLYAKLAVNCRPKWFKGWARLASAEAALENSEEALKHAHQALLYSPNNTQILTLITALESK
eukprot:maker-scaffold_7-snap-gene-10.19-mRNA-1 protein AED:0.30 eAED:0.30 QI:160/1/1/1/1/1/2/102/332